MAAPEIGRRPRWAPTAARIRTGHPLAAGLAALVTPAGLITAPRITASLIPANGAMGAGWTGGGAATEISCPFTVNVNSRWSYFAAVTVLNVTPCTVMGVYESGSLGTADRYLGIRTGNVWSSYSFPGIGQFADGAAATLGPHVIGTVMDGATLTTWLDGTITGSVVNLSTGYTGYANPVLSFGREQQGAAGFGSDVSLPMVMHVAGCYSRALTPPEWAQLNADPFQMLTTL